MEAAVELDLDLRAFQMEKQLDLRAFPMVEGFWASSAFLCLVFSVTLELEYILNINHVNIIYLLKNILLDK